MRKHPPTLLIVAFAVFSGASIDAAVKYLADDMDVFTLMAWRFVIAGICLFGVYFWLGKPVPKWEAIRFHALRGLIQTGSVLTFFWSLTQLALAEATVIGFTSALMIAPIAWLVLGERLSGVAVGAAALGFGGAVLAATGSTEGAPEDANRLAGVIVCLLAALFYALTLVLMRLRTRKEDTFTIVMFTNVFPALYLLPYLIATDPVPAIVDMPIYIGLAAAGVFVWWLMTIGYARAEAQKLAPLEYTALIWASLFGVLIFDETPGWQLWLGAALIIGACLLIALETKFRTRRETGMPASDIPE